MRGDIKLEPFDQAKYEAGFQAIADEVDARVLERAIEIAKETILAKDALIRELRKGYIDMALIIEQLTTKNLTEEDIKDMKERADRLKESIK